MMRTFKYIFSFVGLLVLLFFMVFTIWFFSKKSEGFYIIDKNRNPIACKNRDTLYLKINFKIIDDIRIRKLDVLSYQYGNKNPIGMQIADPQNDLEWIQFAGYCGNNKQLLFTTTKLKINDFEKVNSNNYFKIIELHPSGLK